MILPWGKYFSGYGTYANGFNPRLGESGSVQGTWAHSIGLRMRGGRKAGGILRGNTAGHLRGR